MSHLTQANRNAIHPLPTEPLYPHGPRETQQAFPIVSLPPYWWNGFLQSEPLTSVEDRNIYLPVCLWCEDTFNVAMQSFTGSKQGKLLMLNYIDIDTARIFLEDHLKRVHRINLSISDEYDYTEPYGIICRKNGHGE
jgi:hypothetical protein